MTTLSRFSSGDDARAYRTGRRAALGALFGVILGGPLAGALMSAPPPQPAWYDFALFTGNDPSVHVLPYVSGVLLTVALVLVVSGIRIAATSSAELAAKGARIFTAPPRPSAWPTTSLKGRPRRCRRHHTNRFEAARFRWRAGCVSIRS